MKRSPKFSILLFCLLIETGIHAQLIDSSILKKQWTASWIAVPGEQANNYGVYLFRKNVELSTKPVSFVIHVSADNRYKLFVNGKLVSLGPARGDLTHWNFETVDIASYLQTGKNSIAAKVWNEAEWRPEAQITLRTGFILQGATATEQVINTNDSWKCIRDESYKPIKIILPAYYVAGPGEHIDMNAHIRNWEENYYNDNSWKNAQVLFHGSPKNIMGGYGTIDTWMLVSSGIPQMELKQQRLARVRIATGVNIPSSFPATKTALTIAANTLATILLDQSFLTNAYPTIIFSGGKNGTVSLTYTEALFSKHPVKGNRNVVEGKIVMGRKDSIISDGTKEQAFTPLAWRTYRYIQVQIKTKNEPLLIDDIYGTFTGYPFEYKAKLETENPEMKTMLDIGWRTARLCAVETYMDCPYYEQLQYIGDGRIQGLVSLYNSGDDRLLKNALNLMDHSRQPEGVTLSRHPSFTPQYIPTFSLWYIGMLHDYLMYGTDTNFIKSKLAGERQVLNYFRNYQQADGSLKGVPYWMFTDWVNAKEWNEGVGPIGKDGSSALLDLQLLWACQVAADLENKIGMKEYAALYQQYAAQLKTTIRNKYWDDTKKLFADRPEKDLFSQHANILSILTGMIEKNDAIAMSQQLLTNTALAPASIYFKYYLHRALIKSGLGNEYLNWLGKWRENINMGMTTWAEMSDVNSSRSDCHAWGSSPNIEFFRTVLGIDSDAPGFTKVKIEPHLGDIKNISGEMPHSRGKVGVQYMNNNGKWTMEIRLPAKTTGSFIWKGKSYILKEGKNSLQI
ncbi:MAG TPA: alpha-L-rhamnosidase N-terminal domain-containing protein [Chitinophagaceae bacterium]|nr:alpha-L-rhamnosidase N-terminal domain-containing protein [Chitinophagaceae bacterium]